MYDPKIHNRPKYKDLRRRMRWLQTEAEETLWKYLKHRALGVQFRRQFGLGRYIVDFFCWKEKLIIEVDGNIHNLPDNKEYDKIREDYLKSLGYTILRFKNSEVLNRFEIVIEKIKSTLSL